MHLHVFQHVPFEALGAIEHWAKQRDAIITRTRFFDTDPTFPNLGEIDLLVSMGGPMSVHDEADYPWLQQEKTYIRKALEQGIHVLGICLGAQLVAEALGAEITQNPHKEIGFFPVTMHPDALAHPVCKGLPERLPMFHWHGERFALPEGAIPLGQSDACDMQGFIYGERVLAWQCHPEMTPERLLKMMTHVGDDLRNNGRYIQSASEIVMQQDSLHEVNRYLYMMLDRWIAG